MGRTNSSPTPPAIAKASTCASREPPTPATIAATSAAAASNPNARVSVTYSATPNATAAINHTIHAMEAASVQSGYHESTSPQCRQHDRAREITTHLPAWCSEYARRDTQGRRECGPASPDGEEGSHCHGYDRNTYRRAGISRIHPAILLQVGNLLILRSPAHRGSRPHETNYSAQRSAGRLQQLGPRSPCSALSSAILLEDGTAEYTTAKDVTSPSRAAKLCKEATVGPHPRCAVLFPRRG